MYKTIKEILKKYSRHLKVEKETHSLEFACTTVL